MRKSFFAVLLCVTMLITLLPAVALAADATEILVAGTSVIDGGYYKNNGSTITTAGASASDYNVHYDASSKVLMLNNLVVTNSEAEYIDDGHYNIYAINANGDVTIELSGDSTISTVASPLGRVSIALHNLDGSITVKGTGSLTATVAHNCKQRCIGIYANNNITVTETATLKGIGGSSVLNSSGVTVNGAVNVNSGAALEGYSHNASDTSIGLQAYAFIVSGTGRLCGVSGASGGRFSRGIWAINSITVGDSARVEGRSGACSAGDADSTGIYANRNVTYNGGTVIGSATTSAGAAQAMRGTFAASGTYNWRTTAAGSFTLSTNTPYTLQPSDSYVELTNHLPITFSALTANGSEASSTTALTLTFNQDVTDLAAEDFIVTGATKGTLTKQSSAGVYTLGISDIAVPDGENATVLVSKNGFAFTPSSLTVPVRKYTPVLSASIANVTISGTAGTAITPIDATITLANKEFVTLNKGDTVDWFENLPLGLTAKIKATSPYGATSTTITFSGTPSTASTGVMTVSIPASRFADKTAIDVAANANAKWSIASPSSGGSSNNYGGYSYTPSSITVYNAPFSSGATIWLTGSGLSSSDLLVTEHNPQGSAYEALLKLADSDDVFNTYNIYLRSGKKSAESAMHLSFDLNAQYAGQNFTLVHQKANGTYEYFYDTVDANGDLTFGPLYELSPFMLVKGKLAKTAFTSLTDAPKTGDSAQTVLWTGAALIIAAALAGLTLRKRKMD